jgi:HlyD family secretion protein
VSSLQTAVPSLAQSEVSATGRAASVRRILRWLVPLLVIAAGASAAARFLKAREVPVMRYQTLVVDRGPIAAKVTASGALSALVTVNVGSQVSGRIDSLHVDFGSHVARGQVVATIDPALFRAAMEQAVANQAAAKATFERAVAQRINAEQQYGRSKTLLERRLVAPADHDVAAAALGMARAEERAAAASCEQAKALRNQAALNLHYTKIISPIDGVIISRNVDVGQTVAATLQAPTLFTIAKDLSHMQVDTNVAEADVGKLRAGMDVSFGVDAYPTEVFKGKLRQVRDNAQTLQNVVTYDAVVDVDNAQHLLKPGMTATVSFTYAQQPDALRIANAALRFKPDRALQTQLPREPVQAAGGPDQRVAWLLRAGRAEPVRVRVGISDGVWTEVLAGDVRPGDRAVVEVENDAKPGS